MKSLVFIKFLYKPSIYSYPKASIGSNFAADLAGYHPKNLLVKVHTRKEITISIKNNNFRLNKISPFTLKNKLINFDRTYKLHAL